MKIYNTNVFFKPFYILIFSSQNFFLWSSRSRWK